MTEQLPQDTALRYLLQDLQGRDLRDLEEQLIEDADVQEQVAAVEAELIDDYVAGRLSPAVRARFETHYLADPEAAGKVEFARGLREELSRGAAPAQRTAPRQFPRWMGAAAMLAMAVLTATSAWWAWTMRQELTATRTRLLASSRRAEELSARLAAAEQRRPEDAPTAVPAAESPLPLPQPHRGGLQTAMFLLVPGVSRAPG